MKAAPPSLRLYSVATKLRGVASVAELLAMPAELFDELEVYAVAHEREKARRERAQAARQHRTGKG